MAEFEIGLDAIRAAANPNYHQAFASALDDGIGVFCLDRDLGSPGPEAATASPIISDHGLNERLYLRGRKGFRILTLFPDVDSAFRVLETHGYVRSDAREPSFELLSLLLPPHAAGAALVFGHDFEPAYVFQVID